MSSQISYNVSENFHFRNFYGIYAGDLSQFTGRLYLTCSYFFEISVTLSQVCVEVTMHARAIILESLSLKSFKNLNEFYENIHTKHISFICTFDTGTFILYYVLNVSKRVIYFHQSDLFLVFELIIESIYLY